MTTLLVSGADQRYGFHLLNLVGSVKANSDIFDGIVVYDLGLSDVQRKLFAAAKGIDVRTVPPFVPHWAQGRTWKTWIWTHTDADSIVWLDAGASVLRSLADPVAQIDERGYFLVAAGQPMRDTIPSDYYELYDLPADVADRACVAAGILGFSKASRFYDDVIVPTFEDAARGLSLGASPDEVAKFNQGLERMDTIIVRDCLRFRHEQTLLSIHLHKEFADPHINDVLKYGGWKTSRDHPEQLIWSHRRRGDYRYLWRVRFRWSAAPRAWLTIARVRSRWLRSQHAWKLKPKRYVDKLRSMRR
jgi:hypothetical protein